jgi:hypothetical protein
LQSSSSATLQDSGYATQTSWSSTSERFYLPRASPPSFRRPSQYELVQVHRQVPPTNHTDGPQSNQRLFTSTTLPSNQRLDNSVGTRKSDLGLGLQNRELNHGAFSSTIPAPVSAVACKAHISPISRLSEWAYPHAPPSRCWAADQFMTQPSGHSPNECVWCGLNEMHHLSSQAWETDLTFFKTCLHTHQDKALRNDSKGNSCLHFAAGSGASLEHLAALVDIGVPMLAKNEDSETFLHVLHPRILQSGELVPILRWAVGHGFDMRRKDRQGRTVWHAIFQSGISIETLIELQPLIVSQRDVFRIQDHEDHTPFDCLQSFWTSCKDEASVARLHELQISGQLPLYTSTLDGLGNVSDTTPSILSPRMSMLAINEDEEIQRTASDHTQAPTAAYYITVVPQWHPEASSPEEPVYDLQYKSFLDLDI